MRFFLSLVCFCFTINLNGQTILEGLVINEDSGEVLIGANVVFYQNDLFVKGTSTDFDGKFLIEIAPGVYDVKVSYISCLEKELIGIAIKRDVQSLLNVSMKSGYSEFFPLGCGFKDYDVPLIDRENAVSGLTITDKEIQKQSSKNISDLISQSAGISF